MMMTHGLQSWRTIAMPLNLKLLHMQAGSLRAARSITALLAIMRLMPTARTAAMATAMIPMPIMVIIMMLLQPMHMGLSQRSLLIITTMQIMMLVQRL